MKHGKKPTLNQKKLIRHLGWNPLNWLVIRQSHNELILEHRDTGRTKEYEFKEGEWVMKCMTKKAC